MLLTKIVSADIGKKSLSNGREKSDIQIPYIQRVVFDEFSARLDGVSHQNRKDVVGFYGIVDPDLQQGALLRVMVVSQSCSGFISPKPL